MELPSAQTTLRDMSQFDSWLLSAETSEPFTHCIRCKMPLIELDSGWLINKEFHKGECVLEYAICEKCREEASEEFSEESKMAVRDFLENEIPWEERLQQFVADPESRMKKCVVCGFPSEKTDGYSTSVLLKPNGEVDMGPLPLLICSECTERMTESLSEATRDSWRRFLDDHFESPPQLSSLPGLL